MPAENMVQLMNFSESFELAAYALMEAAGIPCAVSQSNEVLPDLVAFARFEPGQATEAVADLDMPQPGEFFHYVGGSLTVIIHSPRDDQSPLGADTQTRMGELAAKIRVLFRFSQMPFEEGCPHYDVCRLIPTGESYGVNEQRRLDMLTMRWAVDFTINPDAWPTE